MLHKEIHELATVNQLYWLKALSGSSISRSSAEFARGNDCSSAAHWETSTNLLNRRRGDLAINPIAFRLNEDVDTCQARSTEHTLDVDTAIA